MDNESSPMTPAALARLSVADGIAALLATSSLAKDDAIEAMVATAADHLLELRVRCQALGAAVSLAVPGTGAAPARLLPVEALYALEEPLLVQEAIAGHAGWVLTGAISCLPEHAVSPGLMASVATSLAAAGECGPHIASLLARGGDLGGAAAHLAEVLVRCDTPGVDPLRRRAASLIAAEWARTWPEEGLDALGRALAPRLASLSLADAELLDPPGALRLRRAIAAAPPPDGD